MVKLLLGLDTAPSPHDAADALAVAICHAQAGGGRLALQPAARSASPAKLAPREARRRPSATGAVIAHLSGTLLEKQRPAARHRRGGVGYEVLVPLSTLYATGDIGAVVTLARAYARPRRRPAALWIRDVARTRLFERLIAR